MTTPSLITRLKEATGGDREIDADLWWTFCERESGICFANGATGLPRPRDHTQPMPGGMGRFGVRAMAPAYTASLDAALTLVAAKLPGWQWSLTQVGEKVFACLGRPGPSGGLGA